MSAAEAEVEVELRPWATYVEETDLEGAVERKLVIVDAESPEEARLESALIDNTFHLATDDEYEAWEAACSSELTFRELELLTYYTRRVARDLSKRRQKNAREGKTFRGRDRNLFRARKLALLIGKLQQLADEADPDPDDQEDNHASH